MKRNWTLDELVESWTLLPLELELVGNKSGPTRLGFALLLKFFALEARFPAAKNEIPRIVIAHVAKQVAVPPTTTSATTGAAGRSTTIGCRSASFSASVRRCMPMSMQ